MARRRSGQPTKVQRGEPKARKASTAHVSAVNLEEQVAALTRELKEARAVSALRALGSPRRTFVNCPLPLRRCISPPLAGHSILCKSWLSRHGAAKRQD